jgi:hypothetical protein
MCHTNFSEKNVKCFFLSEELDLSNEWTPTWEDVDAEFLPRDCDLIIQWLSRIYK